MLSTRASYGYYLRICTTVWALFNPEDAGGQAVGAIMTCDYHPNFPPSLSIKPNIGAGIEGLSHSAGEGAFGVEAQREAILRYGIAGRVCHLGAYNMYREAAYAMCAYVDPIKSGDVVEFDPPFMEDPHTPLCIIELGSGTGVVAADIARVIGRQAFTSPQSVVIATDLPDVCPLLQHNLIANTRSSENCSCLDQGQELVSVRPLAWGVLDHVTAIASEFSIDHPRARRRLTHIVCSDLVYFPELLGPFLRTLIHLTSLCSSQADSGPPTKVVISYKIRSLSKETPFWSAFGLWFSFRPVLAQSRACRIENDNVSVSKTWRQFGANEDADGTFLFVAHRRPESIAWQIPGADRELIEGVGAWGTNAKKVDDTFETILFMAIDNTDE